MMATTCPASPMRPISSLILDRHRHGLVILPDLRCWTSRSAADRGDDRFSDLVDRPVAVDPLDESLLLDSARPAAPSARS